MPSLPTGPEPAATIEVEYPSSNHLQPLDNEHSQMTAAMSGMADSDWQTSTPALILLRRLTLHHRQEVWQRM